MAAAAPAFQFYPGDFMMGTEGMSNEEVGAYVRLLCVDWAQNGIENSVEVLSRILRESRSKSRRILKRILIKFEEGSDGRLRNQRMERDRQNLQALSEIRGIAGAKGGRAKAANRLAIASRLLQQPASKTVGLQSSIFCTKEIKKEKLAEASNQLPLDPPAEVSSAAAATDPAIAASGSVPYPTEQSHETPDVHRGTATAAAPDVSSAVSAGPRRTEAVAETERERSARAGSHSGGTAGVPVAEREGCVSSHRDGAPSSGIVAAATVIDAPIASSLEQRPSTEPRYPKSWGYVQPGARIVESEHVTRQRIAAHAAARIRARLDPVSDDLKHGLRQLKARLWTPAPKVQSAGRPRGRTRSDR